jgi:flagellar basal-body rod protein FlgB
VNCDLLSDVTSRTLAAALRGTVARHAALANNLANIDTPGFIRTDVRFEEALAATLDQSRGAPDRFGERVSALGLAPRRDRSTPPRADGNNVQIDREMAALARNALSFRAAGELLSARIRTLRAAIRGGRR